MTATSNALILKTMERAAILQIEHRLRPSSKRPREFYARYGGVVRMRELHPTKGWQDTRYEVVKP